MELRKDLELSYAMVYAENITETRLLDLLIQIKALSEQILLFAPTFDLDAQHPYNGYRSAVLFVVKFFFAVHCTKLNENFEGTPTEIIITCQALLKTLHSVIHFYEKATSLEDSSERSDCQVPLQLPVNLDVLLSEIDALQERHIPFIYNKYYEFFYKGTLKNINQNLLSGFVQQFDPLSWLRTLTNSTFSNTSLLLNAMHLHTFKAMFPATQTALVKNFLPFLSSNSFPVIFEKITIKRQVEWLICPYTFKLRRNPHQFTISSRRKKLSCWLLRNTVNSSGHLLLYIFPPSLFNTQFELASSFLRDWSLKLPGCSILIPLFEKENGPFPGALQDCLDVYLWAVGNDCPNVSFDRSSGLGTSNESLDKTPIQPPVSTPSDHERILGAHPENIIIAGDSSGGNFALALCLVLADMRRKFGCVDLPMPSGLTLAYAPFNLRDYSPIMLTSRFHYSLSPIIALTMLDSHLPLPELPETSASAQQPVSMELNSHSQNKSKIKLERKVQRVKKQCKKNERAKQNYFVDRFNKCRLSDFFHPFLDDQHSSDKESELQEKNHLCYRDEDNSDEAMNGDKEDEGEESDNENESDSDDESDSEINFSFVRKYFTKTISSYMASYYGAQERVRLGWLNMDPSDSDDTSETASSQTVIKKNTELKETEQESILGNAFTAFKLFFNNDKKSEKTLNKEQAEKCFSDSRRAAFLELTSCPYVSPTFYTHFEQLTGVHLYLLNSTCDMFLDDNICLAKKWKGPVSLKVMDGLPHGFLMVRFLADAKEGQVAFFTMVKEALQLKKQLPKVIH